MRVDFSEPEGSTCFHYRTSGILNTHQEPEPRKVMASSLSSQLVQALLDHDDSLTNADFPHDPAIIHSFPSIKTGKLTNQNQNRNTTSVNTSSAPPTQPLNPASYGFTAFSASKPPRRRSIQAPAQASTSFSLGRPQNFGKTVSGSGSKFGNGVGFARSDVKYVPKLSMPDQRYHGYALTQDERDMIESLSASNAYRNKSHKKSRWEDYKHGGKGGLFSRTGFKPNATSSRSIPDHPQRRDFERRGGNMTVSAFTSFPAGATTPSYSSTMFPSSSSSAIFRSNPNIGSSSQGKYAGYVPKPNAYTHKSHEELRWGDNKQGDKGGLRPNAAISSSGGGLRLGGPRHGNMSGFGSFPAGVTTSSSSSSVLGQTNAPFTGFAPTMFPSSSSSPYSTTFPAPATSSVQRPHETVVGSSSTSGCRTACEAATMTTNFASQGTTPAIHDYPTLLGTNLAAQGTNLAAQGTTPGLQAYPMMFGTNVNAQGTTTPAFQAYPMMFGTTLGAQGTTPSLQAYPIMFGTNLAAQGTNPAAQGTNPAPQAFPMMFGTNLAAQGTTPAIPAYYPVHGYILLPFAVMSLQ